MKIIEIMPLPNGGHRNQTVSGAVTVPDGWAVIPEGMEIPETFPFVDLVADGNKVVSMTAGVVPKPEPEPEPEPTETEQLRAENKLLKAQIQAQSDRADFIEDCIAEMATQVYGGV